jgi:hypothetical protein
MSIFCDRRHHTFRSLALWLAKYRVCVGLTLRALLHTACCAGQVEGHRAGKDEGVCTALAAPLSARFCLLGILLCSFAPSADARAIQGDSCMYRLTTTLLLRHTRTFAGTVHAGGWQFEVR